MPTTIRVEVVLMPHTTKMTRKWKIAKINQAPAKALLAVLASLYFT